VIEKDPDLTARLLRLGNSSFYGFPSRLETVSEAVSLIGTQQVQDLLVASNVMETFTGISAELVNMESFWRHSLALRCRSAFASDRAADAQAGQVFLSPGCSMTWAGWSSTRRRRT